MWQEPAVLPDFNPAYAGSGSFATNPAGLAYQLMSASLRKRPKRCFAAK
jgi:hypothetical protein